MNYGRSVLILALSISTALSPAAQALETVMIPDNQLAFNDAGLSLARDTTTQDLTANVVKNATISNSVPSEEMSVVLPPETKPLSSSQSLPASSPSTTPAPTPPFTPEPLVAPHLIITKVLTATTNSPSDELIELYNYGDTPITMAGWQLQFLTEKFNDSTTATPPTRLLKKFTNEIIPAGGTYVVRHAKFIAVEPTIPVFDVNYATGSLAQSGSIRLIKDAQVVDLVGWNSAQQHFVQAARDDGRSALQRCQLPNGEPHNLGNNAHDFLAYFDETGAPLLVLGKLPACVTPPAEPEPTVNSCSGLILSEIGANLVTDEQFIEIANTSAAPLEIAGCRVMTNRSSTKAYSFENFSMLPGHFLAIKIADTDLTLTKTTTGTVFLLDSSGAEIDEVGYGAMPAETSLALIDGEWRQTYKLTPGEANIWQKWSVCEDGYWRNEETGRCNKIVEPVQLAPCGPGQYRSDETGRCRSYSTPYVPVPCKEGQYRSEETGRCRSIALAAQVLKPCADDQFRNPATGRCKKIAADDDVLKECAEGFERNPDTNRCRKVLAATAPTVPFRPEQVVTVAGSTLGWWVFGGISLLALGYGVWEWRWEISRLIRRIRSPVSSK